MFRYLHLLILFTLALFQSHGQNSTSIFRITQDTLNAKPVSPLIYGNFIELGFARQIEGLWGQKLNNPSFEEVPPYTAYQFDWLGLSPEDDLTAEPWWHNGYVEEHWYIWPENTEVKLTYNRYWNFHHGLQAAVLKNGLPSGRAYLAQSGIFLNQGEKTRFIGYLSNNRTADPSVNPVTATIGIYPNKDFEHPLFEKEFEVSTGIWGEYSVDIPALPFTGSVTFAVSIGPGKVIACDGFSLMPLNRYRGWRPQVVEALKQIGVPMIRFPGGCFASYYNWREGVGPRLDRQPVKSEYWGGLEENQVGTVEFVDLCRMIEAEPFLCVNILTGTSDLAADWVEYCNGSQETQMGHLRKQQGYPDPFNIKYWELDNEAYRRFGWEEYARKCVEYGKVMKAVDPNIKLVMIAYWRFGDHLAEMLDMAGEWIDVITDRATGEKDLLKDLEIIEKYNKARGTAITLSNTEWLAPLDWEQTSIDALNFQKPPDEMTLQEHQISWHYAMNAARELLLFQRLGGDFEFANFNNLANTWGQNIIECPKDTVFISAAGRVFELMSHSDLAWVMKTDGKSAHPGLMVQSGINQIGDQQIIYILNYSSETQKLRFELEGTRAVGPLAELKTVYADGPLDSNLVGHTNAIHHANEKIPLRSKTKIVLEVKPWSVSEMGVPIENR